MSKYRFRFSEDLKGVILIWEFIYWDIFEL